MRFCAALAGSALFAGASAQNLTAALSPQAGGPGWMLHHSSLAGLAALEGPDRVIALDADGPLSLRGARLAEGGLPGLLVLLSADAAASRPGPYTLKWQSAVGGPAAELRAEARAEVLHLRRQALTSRALAESEPLSALLALRFCGDAYSGLGDGHDVTADFLSGIGASAPDGVKVLDSPSALVESLGPVLPVDADSVRLLAVMTAGAGGPHHAQAVVAELGSSLAVVAFRGSVDWNDWQSNLTAALVNPVWSRRGPQVYAGYHEAYRKVQFLTRWMMGRKGVVFIAGHSRGGALAALLASHASRLKMKAKVRLLAFGAPPAGEDRLYDEVQGILFAREGDPVPQISEVLKAVPGSRAMRYGRHLLMPSRGRRSVLTHLAEPAIPQETSWAKAGAGSGFVQASASIAGALAGSAESRAAHTLGAYRRGLVDRAWEHAIRTRDDAAIISLARLADLMIER